MRQLCCSAFLLVLVSLFATGCIVKVQPVPVLEVHPLKVKLHH